MEAYLLALVRLISVSLLEWGLPFFLIDGGLALSKWGLRDGDDRPLVLKPCSNTPTTLDLVG